MHLPGTKKREFPQDYTGKAPSMAVTPQATANQPSTWSAYATAQNAAFSITDSTMLAEACERCEKVREYTEELENSARALDQKTKLLSDMATAHVLMATLQEPQELALAPSVLQGDTNDSNVPPRGTLDCMSEQLLDVSLVLLNSLEQDLDAAAAKVKNPKFRRIVEYNPK